MNTEFITYCGNAHENRQYAEMFHKRGYTYPQRCDNIIWRRRSVELAERDGNRCRRNGEKDLHLQLHHCFYRYYPDGLMAVPWDYPDKSLITLCRDCHKKEEERVKKEKWKLIDALAERGASSRDYEKLSEAIMGSAFEADIKLATEALAWAVKHPGRFQKLIDTYLKSEEGQKVRGPYIKQP